MTRPIEAQSGEPPVPQDPFYKAMFDYEKALDTTYDRGALKVGYARIEDALARKHRDRVDVSDLFREYGLMSVSASKAQFRA